LSDQAVQVWRGLRRVSFTGHRLIVLELRFQRAQPDTKRVAGVGHYFRPQKAGKLRRVPTRWIIRAELNAQLLLLIFFMRRSPKTEKCSALVSVGGSYIRVCIKLLTASDSAVLTRHPVARAARSLGPSFTNC